MLDPHGRQLLRESLRPPTGYRLDRAIVTTYSLDLMMLLTLPVAFTSFDQDEDDGQWATDPLAILESLRQYSSRIHVFCNAGQIAVPRGAHRLLGYLEESVSQATAPAGGAFHPKVTVLRFAPDGGLSIPEKAIDSDNNRVRYRLLCSSRNVTFDRAWDTVLVLDGILRDRKRPILRNRPLSQFFGLLPRMSRPISDHAATDVRSVAEELLRVEFEVPEGFDDLAFWPIGHTASTPWPFKKEYDRMVVASPFIAGPLLSSLGKYTDELHLVSRTESLDELDRSLLERMTSIHCLDPNVDVFQQANPTDSTTGVDSLEPTKHPPGTDPRSLTGLHAKVYVGDVGRKTHVWTGSANATEAAFGKNVEFLVELIGTRSEHGVERLLERSDSHPRADGSRDRPVSFGDLLMPYQQRPPVVVALDGELDRVLQQVQRQIASLPLRIDVAEHSPDAMPRYLLHVTGAKGLVLPSGVGVRSRPVTLAQSTVEFPGTGEIRFGPVGLEGLTSFLVFDVTATRGPASSAASFVLNVPLHGAPPARRERLLLSVVEDQRQLLRYLTMLLGGETMASGHGTRTLNETDSTHSGPAPQVNTDYLLLEPLLRALDRQPSSLDYVAKLVEDLGATEQGRDLIGPAFMSVWTPIWEARKAATLG